MEELKTLGEHKLSHFESPIRNLILEFIMNQRSMETKKAYYRDLCFFISVMRGEKESSMFWWASLESSHFVLFRNLCEKKKESPRTIQRRLSTLSAFCEFLIIKNILIKNPCRQVKRPYVSRDVMTPDFSNEEGVLHRSPEKRSFRLRIAHIKIPLTFQVDNS
jgi:site-specific recombinase XerC